MAKEPSLGLASFGFVCSGILALAVVLHAPTAWAQNGPAPGSGAAPQQELSLADQFKQNEKAFVLDHKAADIKALVLSQPSLYADLLSLASDPSIADTVKASIGAGLALAVRDLSNPKDPAYNINLATTIQNAVAAATTNASVQTAFTAAGGTQTGATNAGGGPAGGGTTGGGGGGGGGGAVTTSGSGSQTSGSNSGSSSPASSPTTNTTTTTGSGGASSGGGSSVSPS